MVLMTLCLEACYRYTAINITRKDILTAENHLEESAQQEDSSFSRDRAKNTGTQVHLWNISRFLARICPPSPVATINNMAVDLAQEGRYFEAEILFTEAVAEDARLAAGYNNLGVICELNADRHGAFAMYTKACLLAPDNRRFKYNFMTFADVRRQQGNRRQEK